MSFNVKGDGLPLPSAPRFEPVDHVFMTPPSAPTYGDIQKSAYNNYLLVVCDICGEEHTLKSDCSSKPAFPPSCYYPVCEICTGFHPRNRCWFEYMREFLFKPTHCSNCNFIHIGFCKSALYCQYCRRKHNFADGCQQQASIDLSSNLCDQCGLYHSLHCPSELRKIKCTLELYCNRCKIEHTYLECVPFCNKCFRRHREGPCPESFTFCVKCSYCHQGETCKYDKIDNTLKEDIRTLSI